MHENSSSIGVLTQSDVKSDTKLTQDCLHSVLDEDSQLLKVTVSLTMGAILKKNILIMTSLIPSPKPMLRPTPLFPWMLLSQVL